jgi:4-diphosphocytidyl-2-C-methyl-D-erythritol kinase
VVLAKYDRQEVSTPWAYSTYRQQYHNTYVADDSAIQSRTARIHSSPLVKAIVSKNGAEIGKLMWNDLEKVVLPEYPKVSKLKLAFSATNVLGTMMSGSGPTVFALCETQEQAITVKNTVAQAISDSDLEFWVTKLTSNGIHLAE